MPEPSETDQKILRTFLRMVAEKGIDAITTRALAQEAGVNEVTIFRHFKDKATLVQEAFRMANSQTSLKSYRPDIDNHSPQTAQAGLVKCLRLLRDNARSFPELIQFGVGEYWRFPELQDIIASAPKASLSLVQQALAQAAPQLRTEVDQYAAALSLVGLVMITVIWQSRGWLVLDDQEWDRLLEAAVHPLMKTGEMDNG